MKNNVIIEILKKQLILFIRRIRCISLKKDIEIIDTLKFGMMLASVGGFMDVYSYTVRGNVFATGQTGNFVLVAIQLIEKNYGEMFHALVPIVSFWIGVFISWHLFYSYFKEKHLLWKRGTLVIEIVILFVTGLIPSSYPHIIANALVSFAASFQFCAFRKFGNTDAYASVFCTGNMRSCADNYYQGFIRKDKQCLKKAFNYSYILISFFVGAALGALGSSILHEKAIWSATIVLLTALVLSFVSTPNIEKNAILVEETIKEHI